MPSKMIQKDGMHPTLLLVLSWMLLWYLSRVEWFQTLPWAGLVLALIIFIAPGIAVSICLVRDGLSLLSHFTSGLALSLFLVSLLGLAGRFFNLPFEYIKLVFFIAGIVALSILGVQTRAGIALFKPSKFSFIALIFMLLLILFSILVAFWDRFRGDDLSYLAYLTNWQHANLLDFNDVLFLPVSIGPIRFWMAMFPMSLAFLADISGLHGLLLIGFYLEPVFVIIALLSAYNFYDDLLQSKEQALIALFVQITFLFLLLQKQQPGNVFFFRMVEDKVFTAFILAPTFLLALRLFLRSPTKGSIALTLFCGWSIALTHPVILAYIIFIAGIYTFITTVSLKKYRILAVVLILLAVILFPSASLRFVIADDTETRWAIDLESAIQISGSEDRITPIAGSPFYGFNLVNTVKIVTSGNSPWQEFFSWSYLWVLGIALLWSLFNLKKHADTAPLLVASSLLVILAAIPYTGWLMGYVVTARMLWRTTWLFPLGLASFLMFTDLFRYIFMKSTVFIQIDQTIQRTIWAVFLGICILLLTGFSINMYKEKWQSLEELDTYKTKLDQLIVLGDYINKNVGEPSIFLAPPSEFFLARSIGLINFLPGISSKAKVVFFRSQAFTSHPVEIDDLNLVFSANEEVTFEQRMKVIKQYEVQYLLVKDASQKAYFATYPETFKIEKAGKFWVIKVQYNTP